MQKTFNLNFYVQTFDSIVKDLTFELVFSIIIV